MNDLNSILIEGTIIKDVEFVDKEESTFCIFTLASNHYLEKNNKVEKETTLVNIKAWSILAEHCHKMGHKGRSVRVVGHLKQDNTLIIEAEHIEFRPFNKKKPDENLLFDDEENNE